jgi:nucleoside-diphosphate-sugar epimerase
MQAFVTGGSGFVGRNLIAALRRRGDTVRALVRSEGSAQLVAQIGAEPVHGDLDDEEALRRGARGCEVVFHAAAHVEDWGRPEDFQRVNVEGTERLLRVVRAEGVGRFVHVSTEAVLVGGAPLVDVDESRLRPQRPIGLYPRTKGLAEERVLAASSAEFATVVARPRLIWGKGDTSVLPKLVEAVRSGRFMWIDGGRYRTSTCHVVNVVEGLILAAERGLPGQTYFLTDGEPIEMRRFLTALLETQGLSPGERSLPHGLALVLARVCELLWRTLRLSGAPPITETAVRLIGEEVTVNDAKARKELGYREVVTREAGLAAMRS